MKPYTDNDALELAVRCRRAEPYMLPLKDLARIIFRLPPNNRPYWLLQRLQAATEVHVLLTRSESMELVERILGKSGAALEYAMSEHASVPRPDKPPIARAGNPAAP